nr:MAG TPA: hypothetical protein [Caudoviricetes sp.]DAU13342.1 MAG TPA: hypothetical protein [Caudoviricetes sp.]
MNGFSPRLVRLTKTRPKESYKRTGVFLLFMNPA